MKFLVFLLIIFPQLSLALEVDEKLTLRIVGTSETQKTILINRGLEDGLAKGDHAKFFVSSGVVGRGVCIKLSPTRSVWSIYRKVNNDFLRKDQVMKLKITPAVKITKDESRMLVEDDTSVTPKDPRDLGIPLAEGADDIDANAPVRASGESFDQGPVMVTSIAHRNKEIYGLVHYSSHSEKAFPDNNGDEYIQDVSNLFLQIGGEWYFPQDTGWYSNLSFQGSFTVDRQAVMSHMGTYVNEKSSEFGIGVNMYPFAAPSNTYKVITYLNYTFSLGSTNSTYSSGDEAATPIDTSLDASVLKNSFGLGFKYYTGGGYGARLLFSYDLRGDTYAADSLNVKWTKTRVGPRLLAGFSYRF